MNVSEISQKERHSRSEALEEDYVHHVYEKIGKDLTNAKSPLDVAVNEFLDDLEPGSLVADIGCGDGRYLRNRKGIFSLGADSSCLQVSLTRQRYQEAILGDNLRLPLRGDAFDAVLSVAVIHHFTTTQRRIKALKELARILKIGGKILIAVQGHNTQKSQDVLIPWFGVQESKREKVKYLLDQDSGEYDLEDDTDDDDTISLPSSDEEDVPLSVYAKFFPPKSQPNAKHGWIFDRQAYSLDYDYQLPSNCVPNSKKLHPRYDFVRKALMRFASLSDASSLDSELYHRGDSGVPPSPVSEQEQKHFYFLDRTDLNESINKTIHDNFIELLNIDDEKNCSCLLEKRTSFDKENSKCDFTLQENNNTIIHSLSGLFKNMNSMWSAKQTKSCSDLKCESGSNQSYFEKSRLVRSKTTATCNTDFPSSLEDITEYDMTINEANKIIDDFLEASVQTVKLETCDQRKYFTSLICSDIVNLPTHSASSMFVEETFPMQMKPNQVINHSEGILQKQYEDCTDLEKETLKSKFTSVREYNGKAFQTYNCTCDIYFDKNENSNSVKSASNEFAENSTCIQNKFAVINTNKETSKLEDKWSDYRYSEKTFIKHDFITSSNNKDRDLATNKCRECGLFNKSNFQTCTECNILNKSDKSHFTNVSFNLNTEKKIKNINSLMSRNTYCTFKGNADTSKKQVCYQFEDNKNLDTSPKRVKKVSENYICQLNSKTFGPFYDEDYYGGEIYTSLSSYYSMPELHALSDFYDEYNIELVDSIEPSHKYSLKETKPSALNKTSKNDLQLSQNSCIIAKDNLDNLDFNRRTSKEPIDRYVHDKDIKTVLSNSESSELIASSLGTKKLCNNLDNQSLKTNISIKENSKHFFPLFVNTQLNQNTAKDFNFTEYINSFLLNSQTGIKSEWENNIPDSNLCDILLQTNTIAIIENYTANDKVDFKHTSVTTSTKKGRKNSSSNTMYHKQLNPNLQIIDYDSKKRNKTTSKDNVDDNQKKNFILKDISGNEPFCSFLKQTQLVYSNSGIQNGANMNLYPPMQPNNFLSCVLTNTFQTQVVDAMSSQALSSNCIEDQDNDENKPVTNNIETSFQENIDYAYGYINVERPLVVSHRYHHLFQEEELDELIKNNIKDLHVLRSFQYESHLCVIAEKVRVWTI